MVSRKKKSSSSRRRNNRSNLGTAVQRMPGVSEKQIVKLKYAQQFQLNPTLGVADQHLFRANSINDPDFTSGGHQPLGHDEWNIFYNHYTVIGSRCKATFWSAASESLNNDTHIVGIYLDDSADIVPEITSLLEQGKTRPTYMTTGNGNKACVTVTSNYSAKKHLGIKDFQDNRALIGASFNNNPSETMLFHVFDAGTNAGTDPNPINCLVEMEFICYLTEPKTLSQS